MNVVHNIDCMEGMKAMKDNHFNLAICDPPYGIQESAHRNISRGKLAKTSMYRKEIWDQAIPPKEYFDELRRVSQYQIIWGGNYFLDHLPSTRCFIVWDKVNGDTHFADCELAWTNFETSVRKVSFMWNGMLQGDPGDGKRQQGNKSKNEVRIHPTQKPVYLYEWLLKKYAEPGYTILDTHLGSGSSRIAAHNLGFDFFGYEIDKTYFQDQEKRFKEHIKQIRLPYDL